MLTNGEQLITLDDRAYNPPHGVALVAPVKYGVHELQYTEGYAGIERDIGTIAVALADLDIPTYIIGSDDSTINNYSNNITVIPSISECLASQKLTTEQAQVAEVAARQETRRIIGRLARHGLIDTASVFWEEAALINSIFRPDFANLPLTIQLSCSPNDSIVSSMVRHLPPRSLHEPILFTALTHTHQRALLAEAHYAGGQVHDLRTIPDIEVLPYGVACEQIKPSTHYLTESSETPTIPLLQELKRQGKNYMLHVGGITPVKGQAESLAIMQKAWAEGLDDTVLVIVGDADPNNPITDAQRYANEKIRPFIDNSLVYHIPSANEQDKWELNRFALGIFYCSGIEVPDYIEAYCRTLAEGPLVGAPAIGYSNDTFKELIREGITGLGFTTHAEAVANIYKLFTMDRAACAREARQTMQADTYTAQMVDIYRYLSYCHNVRSGSLSEFMGYWPYVFDPDRTKDLHSQAWYDAHTRPHLPAKVPYLRHLDLLAYPQTYLPLS